MKKALIALPSWCYASVMLAQGTVSFHNTATTLVSVGAVGQQTPIAGLPGSYYFGLLIAAPGTSNVAQFNFTGLYATNSGPDFPGRFKAAPGTDLPVPGWMPGTYMSYFVAGWSASLGHDWQQNWIAGSFAGQGYFGLSNVGTGRSGDPAPTPLPGLELFGGVEGIQTGFDLTPVPEPSGLDLAGLAGALLLLRRMVRRKPETRVWKVKP